MNAEALIGTVLGTCTLQKLVGQGGMGAVYLAQQSRPKRQVAVKVLLPMRPLTPNQLAAFLERFRRETDAAASMEHPNIMPVHEYGEREGLAYLVMPYVSGGTLRDELERCGPLPLEKVTSYLEQIAAAIDFAHEHGVIHRDIKPANIMLTPEGRLLLADFGLVKIVADGQAAQVRITGVGAPVGTPDYMSPEQVIGEEVDVRADLYSLGVVLYQMVTGTTPFRGETPMQIAAQHLQVPPPSAQIMRPDLPIGAEQVLQRALAKRPADRYESAQHLAEAFRTALINSGIQLDTSYSTKDFLSGSMTGRFAIPKGQFDPLRRQTMSMPKVSKPVPALQNTDRQVAMRREEEALPVDPLRQTASVPKVSKPVPALHNTGRQVVMRREEEALPVDPLRQTMSMPKVSKPVPALQNTDRQVAMRREEEALPVDPLRQTMSVPKVSKPVPALHNTGRQVAMRREAEALPAPAWSLEPPQLSGRSVLHTRKDPLESTSTYSSVGPDLSQGQNGGGLLSRTGKFPLVGGLGTSPTGESVSSQIRGDGQYVVLPTPPIVGVTAAELVPQSQLDPTRNLTLTLRMKVVLLIAAVVLIAVGLAGLLWFTHHTHAYTPSPGTTVVTTIIL